MEAADALVDDVTWRFPLAIEGRAQLSVGEGLPSVVCETAFALLLARHEPIPVDLIAGATGLSVATLDPVIGELAGGGWLDRDAAGDVTGAAGLSISDGPHRLEIAGGEFRNWCAYDSIGIAAALETDATVNTVCAVCASPITLPIEEGHPPGGRPERLWLAEGGASLRADFCRPTVLLCSAAHGLEWGSRQRGEGRVVGLDEAASLGRETWAGCADAVDRLSGRSDA